MRIFSLLFFFSLFWFSCQQEQTPDTVEAASLIPQPLEIAWQDDGFQFDEQTCILVPNGDPDLLQTASQLAQYIRQKSGFPLLINAEKGPTVNSNVVIFRRDERVDQPEGYLLSVDSDAIRLSANSPAGIFYGVQSLRQMLPVNPSQASDWRIAAVKITDQPRFSYRGMHLDVARHFYPVETIKRYLDWMAYYKFNHFHWHLTDDQGWRIEIKQYPKLTSVGAWRSATRVGHNRDQPARYDSVRYGGYYTQQDILEIVEYAADRYITIVPEIEMPGHASAAIAAYPQLACQEGEYTVATDWGVFENVFCPTEETFTFLQNVLTEVVNLFPGPFIHIGGDEAPTTQWERSSYCRRLIRREGLGDAKGLQAYFIKRMANFLTEKNRQLIGWDEILESGLPENAIVMAWRGEAGGIEAAKEGHTVIMSPNTYCYFDYYQGDPAQEPLAIGGNLPVRKVYQYEPIPAELSAQEAEHIQGAQANVWTEYIREEQHLFYMVYPRAAALAEVLWSPAERRDWQDFASRW
ncbi:MAG: beta-N-acetylhexosaminidase, partial [Bacteroidota bacterium]